MSDDTRPTLAWVIADGIARHDMAPGMPSIDELDPDIAKPYHDLVARFIMPALKKYHPTGVCSTCWGDGLESYEMQEPYVGLRLCEECQDTTDEEGSGWSEKTAERIVDFLGLPSSAEAIDRIGYGFLDYLSGRSTSRLRWCLHCAGVGKPETITIRCFHCDGTGEVDHREAERDPGFVTAEAWGVRMVKCPHCNGVGSKQAGVS